MKYSTLLSSKARWLSSAAVLLAGTFTGNRSVEAGLTLDSSSGSVIYGIFNTTTGTAGTIYGTDGSGDNTVLQDPGKGLPGLGNLVPGTSQVNTASTLSPYFLSSATSTPGSYGSATTETYVATSGQQGGFTTQGGVYWSLKTNLADNLSTPNEASVSYSIATATYTNFGTTPITFTPGAILSVHGTLGSSSSYVAAGLATTISVNDGELSTTTVLDTITLAANGSGTVIAANGGNPNEFASVSLLNTLVPGVSSLTGTGTSLDPNTVTISQYMSVTITSFLTLISDPGSSIGIDENLYGGFPSGPQYIPGFGSFAASPSVAVPEPSTLVLVGAGLALTGLWGRSKRRRIAAKA